MAAPAARGKQDESANNSLCALAHRISRAVRV